MEYAVGDATRPQGPGHKCILHCCNDIGMWGAGFVLALSRRWRTPEARYRRWYYETVRNREISRTTGPLILGNVQHVQVEPDITVFNMIGQHRVGLDGDGKPPIRYNALRLCLTQVAALARRLYPKPVSIHAPRFGAGLAGGDWNRIEALIKEQLEDRGYSVTIYDLPPRGKHNDRSTD